MRTRKTPAPTSYSPGLAAQRDYYAEQAKAGDPKDRPLWQQLADELSARLGEARQTWEPERPLFR